jgi:plasmid rolling circle replication initiator protein Rep
MTKLSKASSVLCTLAPDAKTNKTKSNADNIAALYAKSPVFTRHAKRMTDCSKTIRRLERVNTKTGGVFMTTQAERCRVRHCPVCQRARSSKLFFQMKPALEQINVENQTYRWVFLTLTVENCAITELRDTIKNMNAAWSRLLKIKELSCVKGWLRNVEVTRGKTDENTAHPHFHILLCVPKHYFTGQYYISQAKFGELWRDALRVDYVPMANVQSVKQLNNGIAELTKATTYSVKPSELVDENGADWLHELHKQCDKLRFIASGGLVKQAIAKAKTIENDDEIEVETIAADDYDWNKEKRGYELKKDEAFDTWLATQPTEPILPDGFVENDFL